MKSTSGFVLVAAFATFAGCSSSEKQEAPLVSNLSITQVAGYQVLKTTLMKDGGPATAEVPIIAGKPLTLRTFVAPLDGYDNRVVTVRYELTSGGVTNALEIDKDFYGESTEGSLDSTANLDLTAEQVTEDLTFSVSLREKKKSSKAVENPAAIYPSDGTFAGLDVKVTGVMPMVIVPIQYEADGSGRLPDLSDAAIERLRQRMRNFYPVSDVQITIAEPLSFTRAVKPDGTGWDRLLETLLRKRYDDQPASNVYYYGLFVPSASFENYCGYGCVLGLSLGGDDKTVAWTRGSIGLGYPDDYAESDITFVHEIGHAHGRNHAPCGDPQGIDRKFPYDDGGIGIWGYDAAAKKMLDPEGKSRDMMGYCPNAWVSDYTYKALYDRTVYVNQNAQAKHATRKFRTVLVNSEGAHWGGTVVSAQGGVATTLERVSDAGDVEQIGAQFYPFDHIPGGMLLVPEEEAAFGNLTYRGVTIQ